MRSSKQNAKSMKSRRALARAGVLGGLLLGTLFAGLPFVWMIASSLKRNPDVFAHPPTIWTETSSLASYWSILSDPTKVRFFLNSYVVAFAVVALTLILAIHAAYAFSRYEFPGKSVLNIVIVSVQAVPPVTLLVPYFGLIVALGLYNSYRGLIFTYVVLTLSYAIIMLTGYFNTLPAELDDAGKVDGASSFMVLWRLLVPIATPGIVSVGMYTFMIAWNEYLFALTLTRTNDMRTLPIGIQMLMGQHTFDWSEMLALSVLGAIPVVVVFLFFQRYFVGGMSAGAVKD